MWVSAPTPPGPICPDRPGVCAPRPDAGRPFLPAARAALPAAGAARAARPLRCAPGAGPLRARAALRSRLLGSSVPPRRAARPQPRRSLSLPRAGGGTRGRGRAGERGTEGGSARGRGAGRCSGSPPSPGRGAARRPPPAPRPLPALPTRPPPGSLPRQLLPLAVAAALPAFLSWAPFSLQPAFQFSPLLLPSPFLLSLLPPSASPPLSVSPAPLSPSSSHSSPSVSWPLPCLGLGSSARLSWSLFPIPF